MIDEWYLLTEQLGEIWGVEYAKTYMKVKRVDRKLSLGTVSPNMSILDVGGGIGIDDILFVQKGAFSLVVDVCRRDLKKGKQIANNLGFRGKIEYLVADARELPLQDGSFDMVTSFSAIEHLPCRSEVEVWVSEMTRVLKSGGSFVLTTSNKLWAMYPVVKLLIFLKFRSSEHFFTPKEIVSALVRNNLIIEGFDAAVIYRSVSPAFLRQSFTNRLNEKLEDLLNRLEKFGCFKIICGRMGLLGVKSKVIVRKG